MASLPPLGKPEDLNLAPPAVMKLTPEEEAFMHTVDTVVKNYKGEEFIDSASNTAKVVESMVANDISPKRMRELAEKLHLTDFNASLLLNRVASKQEKEAKQKAVAQSSLKQGETVGSSPGSSPTATKVPNPVSAVKTEDAAKSILTSSEAPSKTASTAESIQAAEKVSDYKTILNETLVTSVKTREDALKVISDLRREGYTASIVWQELDQDTKETKDMFVTGYLPKQKGQDGLTVHHTRITGYPDKLVNMYKVGRDPSNPDAFIETLTHAIMPQIITNKERKELLEKFAQVECSIDSFDLIEANITDEEVESFCIQNLATPSEKAAECVLWADYSDYKLLTKEKIYRVDGKIRRALANPNYEKYRAQGEEPSQPFVLLARSQFEPALLYEKEHSINEEDCPIEQLKEFVRTKQNAVIFKKDDGKHYMVSRWDDGTKDGTILEAEWNIKTKEGLQRIAEPISRSEFLELFKVIKEEKQTLYQSLNQYAFLSEKEANLAIGAGLIKNADVYLRYDNKKDKLYICYNKLRENKDVVVIENKEVVVDEDVKDALLSKESDDITLYDEKDRIVLRKPLLKKDFEKEFQKLLMSNESIQSNAVSINKAEAGFAAAALKGTPFIRYNDGDKHYYVSYWDGVKLVETLVDEDIRKELFKDKQKEITLPGGKKIQKPISKEEFNIRFENALKAGTHKAEADPYSEFRKNYCLEIGTDCTQEQLDDFLSKNERVSVIVKRSDGYWIAQRVAEQNKYFECDFKNIMDQVKNSKKGYITIPHDKLTNDAVFMPITKAELLEKLRVDVDS